MNQDDLYPHEGKRRFSIDRCRCCDELAKADELDTKA